MRLFGYDVLLKKSITEVENADRRTEPNKDVAERLIIQQRYRIRRDMDDWIMAINMALDIYNPDRTQLTYIYDDVNRDSHIRGLINSIKARIKAKDFAIIDESGEADEKATGIINQQWFFDFIDYYVESYFYGYSVIQFGEKNNPFLIKNDTLTGIQLIPRESVVPEKSFIKRTTYMRGNFKDGWNYNLPPYNKYLMQLGRGDFGLYDAISPHAFGKKSLLISCWRFAEMFGMPYRKGHTNVKDVDRRRNMAEMLENMGQNGWGVFDKDDELDFVGGAKTTDVYKVFIEPMKFSNQEISKVVAGQTMVFEDGSSRSQAEVHERLFNDFISGFQRDSQFLINNQLIPRLITLRVPFTNKRFKWLQQESLTRLEKVSIVKDLSLFYSIDPETVEEHTGIKVEPKEIIEEKQQLVKDITELYAGYFENEFNQ